MSTILRNRIQEYVQNEIGDNNAGFRPQRSVTHQLFVVKELQDIHGESNKELYVICLDFLKAYMTLWKGNISKKPWKS